MITEQDVMYIKMLFEMIQMKVYSLDNAEDSLRKYIAAGEETKEKLLSIK